jgi:hypothetical protein
MSRVSLISAGSHRYDGVWLKAGDPFEAINERDAEELCVLGFAHLKPKAVQYARPAEGSLPGPIAALLRAPQLSEEAAPTEDGGPADDADTAGAPAGAASEPAADRVVVDLPKVAEPPRVKRPYVRRNQVAAQ